METGSQELVILSYATVCLHPCVSLNNEKICREISEHKIAVCEKTACLLFEVTTYGLTGPDEIAPRILKECAHQIAPSLYLMFNQSLQLGSLQEEWKLANIIPIHKKGDISYVENYRPISLLGVTSKVLERCVLRKLREYLTSLINSAQHGFIPGRSCTTRSFALHWIHFRLW